MAYIEGPWSLNATRGTREAWERHRSGASNHVDQYRDYTNRKPSHVLRKSGGATGPKQPDQTEQAQA